MLKPIYIKDSDFPKEDNERVTNFDLLEAVSHRVCADAIKCIQLDRNLCRIYFNDKESRDSVFIEGFDSKAYTLMCTTQTFTPLASRTTMIKL